jgi:hypothetical protein
MDLEGAIFVTVSDALASYRNMFPRSQISKLTWSRHIKPRRNKSLEI